MITDNRRTFGALPDGRPVEILTLTSGALSCNILTYGGALQTLTVPDRNRSPVDVLLGFDTLADYLKQEKYLGALIGRYCNRIGGGRFPLNGTEYRLPANDGDNHLHGGERGFDKKLWTVKALSENAVTLTITSPDGEEGYPGNMKVAATYRLAGDSLSLSFEADCDQDTICSLTNHAYFNLSGHQSGPVSDQLIQLHAGRYTPTGAGSIPTGEIAPVAGTPMDLRNETPIGAHIDDNFEQLRLAGGYDHNWVIDGEAGTLRPAARARSLATGITLEVLTTQPGVQFYAGNFLDGTPAGKGGAPYAARHGFCLESQSFPDSPNHPDFPSATLRAGEVYRQETVYRFRI